MTDVAIIDEDFTIEVIEAEENDDLGECETIQEPNASFFEKQSPVIDPEDGPLEYRCRVCLFVTRHNFIYQNHMKSHEDSGSSEHTCKCSLVFDCKSKFTAHLLQCSAVTRQKFSCSDCNFITFKKSALVKHFIRHKDTTKKIINKNCPVCDKSFFETSVKKHLRTHPVFRCDQCDFKTYIKSKLRRHWKLHDPVTILTCDKCTYKTYNRATLKRHSVRFHKEKH